jgi:hypothetical protein
MWMWHTCRNSWAILGANVAKYSSTISATWEHFGMGEAINSPADQCKLPLLRGTWLKRLSSIFLQRLILLVGPTSNQQRALAPAMKGCRNG